MLRVRGRRSSFNAQKVLWLVGELGLAHEPGAASGCWTSRRSARLTRMALCPSSRMTVSRYRSRTPAFATSRRATALALSGRTILPPERASTAGWTGRRRRFQPAFLNGIFWGYYRTPQEQRDWPAIRKSLDRCAELLGLLDRHLADRAFVMGDELSLADIPRRHRALSLFLGMERRSLPNVEAWYRRLQQRPAYREHVMVPSEELRRRLDF